MPTDRDRLIDLTEACEGLLAGDGNVDALRRATTRARVHIDHTEASDLTASRAGYAAGQASGAEARPDRRPGHQ